MNVFSEAQVNEYNEKGCLVFDLNIDDSILDSIISNVNSDYDQSKLTDGKYASGTRIQDAWLNHMPVYTVATLPTVLSGLEQLFGRKVLPFQTLNFPVGTQQKAHSDTVHFNSIPNGYMAGVWVALEDIDENNGPLFYYPGSHKLPEYSMHDFGLEVGFESYREYESILGEKIKEFGLKIECGILKKGQALIWHPNLIHGGSNHEDKNRSRHSQITHYFFEKCKYYTPMYSTPDKIAFRSPNWIRNPNSL